MRQVWTGDDLEQHWRLADDEVELVQRIHNRLILGFALQLKYLAQCPVSYDEPPFRFSMKPTNR